MTESFRVLIVEDDDEQAEMVAEFLKVSGPFITERTSTVKGIWNYLSNQPIDAILLDYRLPDGNGLKAMQEINKRQYKVPVLMITGQGDERLAVQAIQLGARDYLVKGTDDLRKLPSLVQKAIQEKQHERAIRSSVEESNYQALLLNNVRDAVVVWDREGIITFWNPAAEILLGQRAEECLGKPVRDDYFNAFTPPVQEPPPEGTAGMEIERRFTLKDGRVIWVSSRVSALRDHQAGGRVIGYMDVLRDFTERKRMEAQIRTAQARLAQTARLAAIGDLASGIAHHINNPLTTIIAEAQILLSKLEPNHPFRDSIEAVEKAGWRVQDAVQRLIEFAQPAPDTIEDLSINDTIEKAVALVDELLRARRINLELNLADNLPWIQSNPSLLGDLWVNLLMYTRNRISDNQSHLISIQSRILPDGSIRVDITDDGEPISEEEAAALRDISIHQTYDQHNTGPELVICQEIVQQHNGRLSIENLPERGTIIRVSIPVEV